MQRRQFWLATGLLVMIAMSLWNPLLHADTQSPEDSEDVRAAEGFVVGHYDMIGREPDSKRTFTGEIEIRAESDRPGNLVVLRRIGGQVVRATGRIETAPIAETRVLRLRFKVRNVPYEGTYLFHGDLDNYARISGYVYRKDGKTKVPGLEALFHLGPGD